jgi:NAD(P)-dependent dehydrogenase (short-subunit alcohol dehydrogenase family)
VSCPLEFQPIEELQKVFQVNVFGVVAVTQAMLPMIRRAQGRVVNIGSIGDRFTVPFGGALCSSKAAVRSLTEALRLELHPFGIHVALVQPTSIATPAVTKFKDEAEARLRTLPPVASELYGDLYRGFIQRAVEEESKGSPPEVVAEAVYEALSEQRPRTRYPVGKGRTLMSILPAVVPDRAFDFIKLLLFGMPVAFGALAMRKVVQARQAAEPRGEETVS